jgi:hypothetical protein
VVRSRAKAALVRATSNDNNVCKHKSFFASMFYQNIGPSGVHVFIIFPGVYFSSKNPVIFCMLISWQNIFFIIPKYVFYASSSTFFFSRSACFLLICCMLYYSTFVTYPLHVSYFSTACFFSRMYSLF